MSKLSAAQCDQYWDDGFLFPLQVLSTDTAAAYRRQLEAIEAQSQSFQKPRVLNEYLRAHAELVMPMAAELATNSHVLDAVEDVLGPDLFIWSAEFFIKEPQTKHIVSMHQDLTYWGFGETSNQVTAWIALSPSTTESGCMNLVRASHKNPILPHNDTHAKNNMLSRGQEVKVEVAERDKVRVELQAGEMSLHHGLAIHGSDENQSSDRRIGFAIRYVNPTAGEQSPNTYHAMLARGQDKHAVFKLSEKPQSLFSDESVETYEQVRSHIDTILGAGMEKDKVLFS